MNEKLSHAELCLIAVRWLKNKNCPIVIKERSSNYTSEIPDAIGFRNGISFLIECKTSRSDFLADKNKSFRSQENEELGMGEFRFYLSEPDIIKDYDVPDKWGLIHVKNGKARMVKRSKMFNVNLQAERGLLYAILRGLNPHEKYGTWEYIAKR